MGKINRDLILVLAVTVLIIPKNAHAYLDPGAGSMIIQYIAAVLFAGLFVVKSFWRQIRAFFEGIFGKKSEEKDKNDIKRDEKNEPKNSKNKKG